MRLVDPGPGELLDRLTILDLKVQNANGRPTRHWEEEHMKILEMLEFISLPVPDQQVSTHANLVDNLRSVNEKIWRLIDELRLYPDPDRVELGGGILRRIAIVGWQIQDLNQLRALVIGKLNALYGVETRREKLNV